MSDRLQEIRARLDAATPGLDGRLRRVQPTPQPWGPPLTYEVDKPNADLIAHAPADIAWLLGRLDFQTRLVADLEAQLDRAHERYAAEIERLRNTKISVSQPLCDGAADA